MHAYFSTCVLETQKNDVILESKVAQLDSCSEIDDCMYKRRYENVREKTSNLQ